MRDSKFEEDILQALTLFVRKLNDESKNGALVVVEGQHDAEALESIGFKGKTFQLCHNRSLIELSSEAEKYRKVILLLDLDRKGRVLTKKAAIILQGKNKKIDLFFRREIAKATKGRIRQIEELTRFGEDLQNLVRLN
ncbi:MAG: toprim domain-containing protein [Candidatus Methylarchaceae archaeon HK01B]|nr:toprim domain-containing protein [Candidatus Methylarchaceae archaeon HK01M]MCP8311651.1 toprim domain-containing protein [Candidatus Methylarchaceae archaeon HK02M1]MCP8319126.1 toprim domain-containing protein [Candidatus Methylarchaceae archaeon HK01B]